MTSRSNIRALATSVSPARSIKSGRGVFSKFTLIFIAAMLGSAYYKFHNITLPLWHNLTGGSNHAKSIKTNEKTKLTTEQFIKAAVAGNQELIKQSLTLGINPNAHDARGRTALMGAAYHGKNNICNQLLAAGANVDMRDAKGFNALDYASSRGLLETVQLLLKKSNSKNAKKYIEYTQLMKSAFAGDVSFLPLGDGVLSSVNQISAEGRYPLHIATSRGSIELATILLKRGARVDLVNYNGQTPLHWAAWGNQTQMIDLLLKNSANINVADKTGNTPLMLAVTNGHKEAISLLLAKSANKTIRNKNTKNAEDIARQSNNNELLWLLK